MGCGLTNRQEFLMQVVRIGVVAAVVVVVVVVGNVVERNGSVERIVFLMCLD